MQPKAGIRSNDSKHNQRTLIEKVWPCLMEISQTTKALGQLKLALHYATEFEFSFGT